MDENSEDYKAGAKAQEEKDKASMYSYKEVTSIINNLRKYVKDIQNGSTKMTAAKWLKSIKK